MLFRDQLPRQISLTREGWLFLVILGFISVGAVLRNVNLLILMAGLMFAPLFVNWRLGVLRLKTLSAHRSLPNRIHARQLASFQWICQNDSRVSAWNVEIRDVVHRDDPEFESATTIKKRNRWNWLRWIIKLDRTPRSNAKIALVQIGPGKSEVGAYRIYFVERGRYQAGPARLTTSFPFGLIQSQIMIPEEKCFYVAPEVGRLSPVWEQRVRSSVVGSDAIKRKRGLDEDEFYALRPWRSGDSKKNIHWRTSARFGQPIVRQHDQQDNRDFALMLELFSEPTDPAAPHPNGETGPAQSSRLACEEALKFGATVLLQTGHAVQGRIAIAICGRESVVCRSRYHREIINESMKQMAIAQPSAGPRVVDCLLRLASSVSASTPLYVISSRRLPAGFGYQNLLDCEFRTSAVETTSGQIDTAGLQTATPAIDSRIERQLKAIWSAIRWISVDSAEFRSMFTCDADSQKAAISKLARKWNQENVTR